MYEDGGFIVKGRVVDALRFKVFAKVIYPGPIEQALGSHPSIRDISVSVVDLHAVWPITLAATSLLLVSGPRGSWWYIYIYVYIYINIKKYIY